LISEPEVQPESEDEPRQKEALVLDGRPGEAAVGPEEEDAANSHAEEEAGAEKE
jgi:hypothetical protein